MSGVDLGERLVGVAAAGTVHYALWRGWQPFLFRCHNLSGPGVT